MGFDITYHDDETMQKVWKGLRAAGLDDQEIQDAANCVMNQGIVFREHREVPPYATLGNPDEVEVSEPRPPSPEGGFTSYVDPKVVMTYEPPRRFTGFRWSWGRRS